MAEVDKIISSVLGSIAAVFAKESIEALTMLLKKTVENFQQRGVMKGDEISQLAEVVKKNPPPQIQMQMNIDTLSRWFEIPRDDFERVPPDKLEPEVLIRHVYLEQLFATWLEEFGYESMVGSKMLGVEGWEFLPDVYGQMTTLHGTFQVAVNLVCDDPPSTSRVSFLCESLEAFAAKREPEFSDKDLFLLATPFKFSATAHSIILKEDKDHSYYVVKLEGSDLYRLQEAEEKEHRLNLLQAIVKEAYGSGGKKTWV